MQEPACPGTLPFPCRLPSNPAAPSKKFFRKAKLSVVPLREVRKSPSLVEVDRLYDRDRLNVKIENPLVGD